MVAKPGTYQASFNAGELAPALHGNTSLKQYYAGAALMLGVEPVPQGGFRQLPRSRWRGWARRALASVATAGPTASASISTAITAITWTFASVSCAVLDINALSGSVATATRVLAVEVRRASDSAWIAVGGLLAVPLAVAAATRRLGFAPGSPLSITGVRLRYASPPSAATVLTASLEVWAEAASGVPEARCRPFTVSTALNYRMVLIAGHADFWLGASWVGCCRHPYQDADLATLDYQQRFETGLFFGGAQPPGRILRRGLDWDWSFDVPGFRHLPQVDLGGSYTAVAEQWDVVITWDTTLTADQVSFALSVDGDDTGNIDVAAGPDWTATGNAVIAALEALAGVEAGLTVSNFAVAGGSNRLLRITFAGSLNAGAHFTLGGRVINTDKASLTTYRSRKGIPGGEDLMSVARGWPAAGAFWQDRLILGGFSAKTSAFCASRTGEYFDLNTELENAAGAILLNLDTDGGEAIRRIARGRHLVLFTTDGHYYLSNATLSRTDTQNIVRSEANGVSPRVPIIEQEGGLLFVNEAESTVYAAAYDDQSKAYVSAALSLLATHLIGGIRGAALQRSQSATDADRYMLVRDDGLMIFGALVRNQEVTAWSRWQTDGSVRDAMVDGGNATVLLVERTVAGVQRLGLEELEEGLCVDQAVTLALGAPATALTGLAPLAGATVWALADGAWTGPLTVAADGTCTLPFAATAVTLGRRTAPIVTTLPLVRDVGPRTVLRRPARVHTVELDVIETDQLAVGANDRPARAVPLGRAGDPVDAPVPARSGALTVTGLAGFTGAGQVTITQVRPGRLQVRDVTIQARV